MSPSTRRYDQMIDRILSIISNRLAPNIVTSKALRPRKAESATICGRSKFLPSIGRSLDASEKSIEHAYFYWLRLREKEIYHLQGHHAKIHESDCGHGTQGQQKR